MTKSLPLAWLVVGIAGVAAVSVGAWWWSHRSVEPVPPAAHSTPATEPPPPPQAPQPVAAAGTPAEDPKARIVPILYPDGSRQPPLNGVKAAPSLYWPKEVPFTPVVGKFTDVQGVEWYKHADGSQSTTQMIWRKDLGREDAVSRVAAPTTPLPMLLENADGSSQIVPMPKPATPPAAGGTGRKS